MSRFPPHALFVVLVGVGVGAFVAGPLRLSGLSALLAGLTTGLGVALWLRGERTPQDHTQLGAAILGGAVVALALYVLEEDRQRATDRLVEQQSRALQLAVTDDLRGIDLTGAQLGSAYLANKMLAGATLADADLAGANLSNANISNVYADDAIFTCATMIRVRAPAAPVLTDAQLDGASLQRADLSATDLTGADLRSAYLKGADLRRADLTQADLTGAVFDEARLAGARFAGARLHGAFLQAADLSRARFEGAIFDAGTMWPPGFDPIDAGAVESPPFGERPRPLGRRAYCRAEGYLGD